MAHRRGRAGVGRLKGGPKFTKKAEEIKEVSLSSAVETVKKLEVKLTEFAKKHKKEIQEDPLFRKKFLEMCAPLGVDPLSSKKGFWGGVLGIGEFYYELAVKVAEVCLASRSRNGGIMSVAEVQSILMKRGTKFRFAESEMKSSKYSKEDIITSIGKLSKLGSGFRTVQIGKSVMVVSVPTELDNDHMEVMKVAQDEVSGKGSSGISGEVTLDEIQKVTGWDKKRARRAVELLLSKGMAWLDHHEGIDRYWFPSVWKEGLTNVEE
jgi:ESCRT-II complex subunit VPS22